ncbi:MAG: hypothetical protein IT364_16410 [Candidatus Hydrogenedentes bacterium]|nr:hypothetical protein [Candidatus Hydrogenedentota bacterium]
MRNPVPHIMPSPFLLLWIAAVPVCFAQETSIDYADSRWRDAWLRHPVLGDASFDSFVHAPGNPICRGSAPYEWPVNGFLFEDPVSRDWFVYVGEYCKGYAMVPEAPSRCVVYRSRDKGATWERLAPIFPDASRHVFDGETAALDHYPDVSVVYAEGRYHMCFDFSTKNTTWEKAANPGPESNSGVGYAWADQPEGPFHPTAKPLATTRDQTPLLGKYKRLYASTLIRRANDWLVLTLTDSGPYFGWALAGMTSANPEGPYTEPKLLLHPECDKYHPPLLEFFPAFVMDGTIYAPATSVALNRNYQAMFTVPIEQAMEPAAWELTTAGGIWHAEPVEHEAYGIWGQTFSGMIVGDNFDFHVMFPSRDIQGMGTINIASRPWDKPYRECGFVVSGHEGPSLALVPFGGTVNTLVAQLDLHGTATLVWDFNGPLGPNAARSNATIHPQTLTRYSGLRLTEKDWSLVSVDEKAAESVLASGQGSPSGARIRVERAEGECVITIGENEVWRGSQSKVSGHVGVLMAAHSHALVHQFEVSGKTQHGPLSYLYTDALLGAAQRMDDWEVAPSSNWRFGEGVVSRTPGTRAKWNFHGTDVHLWCPKGPEFGAAEVFLDGASRGLVDCHAETPAASAPVLRIHAEAAGAHALTIVPKGVGFPLDSIDVQNLAPIE